MLLSDVLGKRVVDAGNHRVGWVTDVRLTISGGLQDNPASPRVLGFVISPRTRSSYLGYERSDARAPVMLAALFRWRHRGTFVAAWEDVETVGSELVRLRRGYTRYSPLLRGAGV
jgi:hypothetical protein